jgi:hypothetical protein
LLSKTLQAASPRLSTASGRLGLLEGKVCMLQKILGQWKHLDLEILKDATQVLQQLQKVDGIGESTLVKMKEFV